MDAPEAGYQLGSDAVELERLNRQGMVLAPATRMILQAAGIGLGMRVLDLGSGTGDVAFVAAELVGPAGEVVGIDSSPEAVATAQARAQQRGLGNVRFVMGDIHEPAPGGPFDVIVGRLVLMYVPDPPVVLRTQAALLRPGPDPQDADAGDPHRLASRRNAQQLPSVGARIATAHPRPCRPRRPDPRW